MNNEPLELTPTARDLFLAMIPDRAWLDQKVAIGEIRMIPDEGAASCKA
jgi:hypothetical protein